MINEGADRKRLVILTRDGPAHCYVVNALCAAVAIDCVIVDRRPQKPNLRRAMRLGWRHFASKAARTVLLKAIADDSARDRALQRLFGAQGKTFANPAIVREVDGINSEQTAALLRQFKPDAMLIYGTSVVRNPILEMAGEICFNMHTGISPYYRGTACSFWPVANGQFDMLGATIHECSPVIDGGAIFEIAYTRCEPGDNLHTVFGRTVIAGAAAYVRVVERFLAGRLEGTPQDLRVGREYRGSDLTLGAELTARLRLARLRTQALRA